jgi:multiple sugar transport system permease protein
MTSTSASASGQPTVPAGLPPRRLRPRDMRRAGGSFAWTLIAVCIVAAFLSPLLRSASFAVKSNNQIQQPGSPLYPADPLTFVYQGHTLDVYQVPIDGAMRDLALVKKGRAESQFVDPANPDAGLITWQGSWRSLDAAWVFSPHLENFGAVWDLLDYPRLLFNTIAIALIGMVGTLLSCTLVAYGFARFRFPGRNILFGLLIATIFLPSAVTLIPTYTIFQRLGWVGTWLPLLVPTFFANAFDVFLMRQFFLTLPRDLDEAASLDGASPLRVLWSVILPQSVPVVVAVAVFHVVYSWNDFFAPLIYLSTNTDLQPLAVGLARFNGIHSREPALIQAGTLMTMVVPVILFLVFQKAFTKGVVITGVEK